MPLFEILPSYGYLLDVAIESGLTRSLSLLNFTQEKLLTGNNNFVAISGQSLDIKGFPENRHAL